MNKYELYYTNWDEDIVARKEYEFTAADIPSAVKYIMGKQPTHISTREMDIEQSLDRAMIDLQDGEREITFVIEPVSD